MLKQKILVQFGSNILTKVLAMIGGIIVARFAGPDVLGTVAYGAAFAGIFSFITGIWGTGHIKLISEGQPVDKCIGTYKYLMLSSASLFLIVAFSWFSIQKFLFNGFESSVVEIVVVISIFAFLFDVLFTASQTTFTARMEQYRANYPVLLKSLVYQIFRILLALLGFGAIAIALGKIVAAILVLPFLIILFKKFPKGDYDKALAKQYIGYAKPVLFIVIANVIVQHSDKLLLKEYYDTTVVGYYTAAFSLGGLVLLLGRSIGSVFFPLFSGYISKGDWENVNIKSYKYLNLLILIQPIILLIALLAQPIITIILGPTFSASIIPFSLLILATYFLIFSQPFENVISGMGRLKTYAYVQWARMIIFIISGIVLISPKLLGLGAEGMAATTLISFFSQGLLFVIISKRIGQIEIRFKSFISNFLLIGFSFILYTALSLYNGKDFLFWVIFIVLFLIANYLYLYFTGFLNKEILQDAKQIVNFKQLKDYIKSERES